MNRLPAIERDALLMSIVDNLSVAEIAEVLGRSTKAANSLLGRAHSLLAVNYQEFPIALRSHHNRTHVVSLFRVGSQLADILPQIFPLLLVP